MPVTPETRENGLVQYFRFTDPFSLQELNAVYQADEDYRNTVNFTVHSLMDVTGLKQIPSGILGTRVTSPMLTHPLSGQIVLTGAGSFAKAIGEMVARIARLKENRFKVFRTADEGWAYLRQYIQDQAAKQTTGQAGQ